MNEIVIFTAQSYTAKFEPVRMLQELRTVKNMDDAIKSDPNGLAFYRKQVGEDTILAVIEMHLVSLGQSINVHEKLSRTQCGEIALEIVTLYYYMNMVEIAHVFRRAKRGEYGPIKYALNMPDVLQWFALYSEERISHFINKSEQSSQKDKNEKAVENGVLVNKLAEKFPPEILEQLGKIKKDFPGKKDDIEAFKKWKKENNY